MTRTANTETAMQILRPPVTPTSQLSYDAATYTYFGEISSTNGFGRLYDDACDEGMTLLGKTREVVFAITGVQVDNDGDITSYELRALEGQYGYAEGLNLLKVVLFND